MSQGPSAQAASAAPSLHFPSLLQLRWGAIAAQILVIILIAEYQPAPLPYPMISAIIGFETASNLFFQRRRRQRQFISPAFFAGVMFADVLLLTALLYQTGGAMNPFTFLYLLHIVIGAILMPPHWAWALAIATIACYASLLLPVFEPPGEGQPPRIVCADVQAAAQAEARQISLHLKGMLVAFAITSLFIVFFIGRINKVLARHNDMLLQLEQQRRNNEKLASLATLAAGTAHEFSTPLSTIKLAAGEMLYSIEHGGGGDDLTEDLLLIRSQVAVCEEILNQMSGEAGKQRCEDFRGSTIDSLVAESLAMLDTAVRSRIQVTIADGGRVIHGPLRAFGRTIKELLKNAVDASGGPDGVALDVTHDDSYLSFTVTDRGPGIPEAMREAASEPFFTTKPPGRGMGLGLYLARTLAEQFGGRLDIGSAGEAGARVSLVVALNCLEAAREEEQP